MRHRAKNEEQFDNTYINSTEYKVVNEEQFKNRITGLVSFYNEISGKDAETGSDLFPEKLIASEEETTVEMSDYQFIEYFNWREYERKMELQSKKAMRFNQRREINTQVKKTSNVFRVFTRLCGLFTFPPGITRPRLSPEMRTRESRAKIPVEFRDVFVETMKIYESKSFPEETKNHKYDELIEEQTDSNKRQFVINMIDSLKKGEAITNYDEFLLKYGDVKAEDCDEIEECTVVEKIEHEVSCEKAVSELTEENLTLGMKGEFNLKVLSPKFAKIVENINGSPGNVLCYSFYRHCEGINVFTRVLEANGYTEIEFIGGKKELTMKKDESIAAGIRVRYSEDGENWATYMVTDYDERTDMVMLEGIEEPIERSKVFKCFFAQWKGRTEEEKSAAVLKYFNQGDNKWGQLCQIILITKSGAEGINLKCVRQVHILEPYWNDVLIQQVIGRARRIKSHVSLPKEQQNVKVFNYRIK
jgi:hypothetical protein